MRASSLAPKETSNKLSSLANSSKVNERKDETKLPAIPNKSQAASGAASQRPLMETENARQKLLGSKFN